MRPEAIRVLFNDAEALAKLHELEMQYSKSVFEIQMQRKEIVHAMYKKGMPNKLIADAMGVSMKTLFNYMWENKIGRHVDED